MADFYDPISDVQIQWSSTGAAHYTEIDEGIRNPNQPTLTDYLRTNSPNATDEWGFPTVSGTPVAITAWLYAETGSNSNIIISLQQGGVERATTTIPINSLKRWYKCQWDSPSGDLSTLTIEVKQTKPGGGAGTYAYIYAAYLRAGPNLDKQVAASGDDGFVYGPYFNVAGSEIHVGSSAAFPPRHLFARWIGVTIEGTIDVSYTQLFAYEQYGTPERKVRGVDEDNPNAPTTKAEFDADPLTDAGVDWDTSWSPDAWYQSPSLNAIFQELVNTYAISNEAVMLQVRDDKGLTADHYNICRSYDLGDHTWSPKLHIEYTAGGPTPGWNKLAYTSEPPTPNAWNQLKQEAGAGYVKLLYEGE